MKKLSLTVKSLLVLAVAASMGACAKSDKAADQPQAAQPEQAEAAVAAVTNIRYIDADSILRSYKLAQQLMEEQQREINRLQQWHESKQRELQSMANNIQQKQQNNVYLSQASMESDMNNLQKKSEEAERYFATQQQRLANSGMEIQQRLSDSISGYVQQYNATRGYDAILLREAGVYFNPALNITADIIEGLNARFDASADKK